VPVLYIYLYGTKYYWALIKRVMHISSNEILSQNQLAMGKVIHKFIKMLKPLYFINVRQTPPFILQH